MAEAGEEGPPIESSSTNTSFPVPLLEHLEDKLTKWTDTTGMSHEILDQVSMTYEQMRELESSTRGKANFETWKIHRAKRLTASHFGEIIAEIRKPNPKPALLATKMNYPVVNYYQQTMQNWGTKMEPVAVDNYKSKNTSIKVKSCGLFISPEDPFLGATPDGVVYDRFMNPHWGVLEVKCPYEARNITLKTAVKQKKVFLKKQNPKSVRLTLDKDTVYSQGWKYYCQVQGQMAVTGAKWCRLVVYTNKDLHIETIRFNEEFWRNMALDLEKFFKLLHSGNSS